MPSSESGINANEFNLELPAVAKTAFSLAALQNSSAMPTPSDQEHQSQLQAAVYLLESARAVTIQSENFQGDQSVALNALDRAVQDVQLAIDTGCGYLVICLPN